MTYDSVKRLATHTDRKGQLHRYGYDAEGRLSRLQRPDGTLTMTYDAVGRVVRIEDTASGGSTLAYEYDTLDRRIRRTVNGSDATTYTWDRVSRLASIGHDGQQCQR